MIESNLHFILFDELFWKEYEFLMSQKNVAVAIEIGEKNKQTLLAQRSDINNSFNVYKRNPYATGS